MPMQGVHHMSDSNIKGHIFVNSFLHTDKFTQHYKWLKEAAKKYGAELSIIKNSDIFCSYKTSLEKRITDILKEDSFVIYWDKDIRLGRQVEYICRRIGIPVYNSIDSIAICDDKSLTYQKLWEWNQNKTDAEKIPLIPTIIAPMTYTNVGYTDSVFLDKVAEEFSFPLIVKECYGSFGKQVYLVKDREQLEKLVLKLGGIPHLYQKFISKSSGRDVRIEVVGDCAVAAMYRYSVNGSFKANITSGAHMKPYKPSEAECKLAIKTAKVLGIDFSGIDLLFKDNDKEALLVCEVNSNAHFKNIFDCTGINIADEIIKYILNRGKEMKK